MTDQTPINPARVLAALETLGWPDDRGYQYERMPNSYQLAEDAIRAADKATSEHLIGPLTPAEWCAFRARDDDDLLRCCAITSEFRDRLFYVLRMGGDRYVGQGVFRQAWKAMVEHGFPEGPEVAPLFDKLRVFYIDPPAVKDES